MNRKDLIKVKCFNGETEIFKSCCGLNVQVGHKCPICKKVVE